MAPRPLLCAALCALALGASRGAGARPHHAQPGGATPTPATTSAGAAPAEGAAPGGGSMDPGGEPPEPAAPTTKGAKGKPKRVGWPSPAAGPSRTGAPEIIFTFDDGPNEPTTKLVLDTLAKHHVHAIFFMNGWHFETKAPEAATRMIHRIVAEGHVIANHTQDHLQLCSMKDDEKRAYQVDHSHDLLARLSGLPIVWFRTPYGSHCQRVLDLLAERHLDHFHWDIDAQEWKHPDPRRAATYIITHIQHLQDRAVILMHDTKQATAHALPQILDWLDAENARRTANGRQPIHVLSGSDLALERMAPGLVDWARDTAAGAASGVADDVAAALP